MGRAWSRWRPRLVPRQPTTDQAAISSSESKRLVRRLTYAYIDWREECAALEAAYRNWVSAEASDAELAFAAYRAALDREQRASVIYGELVSQGKKVLPEDLIPPPGVAATPGPG
jgi:hypothetical protein